MDLHVFVVATNYKFIHNSISKETRKQVVSHVEMLLLFPLKKAHFISSGATFSYSCV